MPCRLPADDELLIRWRKLPQPAVPLPPPGLQLTGWRDPFVYRGARSAEPEPAEAAAAHAVHRRHEQQQGGRGEPGGGYRMLLGSGTKERGGALLGYRSPRAGGRSSGSEGSDGHAGSSLAVGWEYTGPVCSVADLAAADLADVSADVADSFGRAAPELGEVWECPLLARLPGGAGSNGNSNGGSANSGSRISAEEAPWLVAVSPYPAKPPNAPSNPVLYWIGRLGSDGTRLEFPEACQPACALHPCC